MQTDVNKSEFERLRDRGKLKQYEGQFICIVDGKLVDYDTNETALLEMVRKDYRDNPRYFTQVIDGGRDETIDIAEVSVNHYEK